MAYSKLVDAKYLAYSGNYTKGRNKKISKITIHHMAGVLTAKECGAIFQKVGRKGSSNYGIGKNAEVGLYVDESNTSWCDSNWDSNCKSVTIEVSNSKKGGDWLVSDKVLEKLILLVADIAKRNNLGTLVKGKNVTWHSMYTNTACPGKYLLSKMDYIVNKANEINQAEENELKIVEIEKKKVVLNVNANLWDLTFKSYNDAKAVKTYNKGDIIDNIVAIAEHPLGSKYYLTEYSYKNGIKNGFNVVDCEDYVEPTPQIPNESEENTSNSNENEKVDEIPMEEEKTENDPNNESNSTNTIMRLLKLIIELIKKVFNK